MARSLKIKDEVEKIFPNGNKFNKKISRGINIPKWH
jgi:hypothetical protein